MDNSNYNNRRRHNHHQQQHPYNGVSSSSMSSYNHSNQSHHHPDRLSNININEQEQQQKNSNAALSAEQMMGTRFVGNVGLAGEGAAGLTGDLGIGRLGLASTRSLGLGLGPSSAFDSCSATRKASTDYSTSLLPTTLSNLSPSIAHLPLAPSSRISATTSMLRLPLSNPPPVPPSIAALGSCNPSFPYSSSPPTPPVTAISVPIPSVLSSSLPSKNTSSLKNYIMNQNRTNSGDITNSAPNQHFPLQQQLQQQQLRNSMNDTTTGTYDFNNNSSTEPNANNSNNTRALRRSHGSYKRRHSSIKSSSITGTLPTALANFGGREHQQEEESTWEKNSFEPVPIDYGSYGVLDQGQGQGNAQERERVQQWRQELQRQFFGTSQYSAPVSTKPIVSANNGTDGVNQQSREELLSQYVQQIRRGQPKQQQETLVDPFYSTKHISRQIAYITDEVKAPMPITSMSPTKSKEQSINEQERKTSISSSHSINNSDNSNNNEERQKFLVFIHILFKLLDDAYAQAPQATATTRKNRSSSLSDESPIVALSSTARRTATVGNTTNSYEGRDGQGKEESGISTKNNEMNVHARQIVKECTNGFRLGIKGYQPLMDIINMKLKGLDGIDQHLEKARSQLEKFWSKRKMCQQQQQKPREQQRQEQPCEERLHQEQAHSVKRMRYDRFHNRGNIGNDNDGIEIIDSDRHEGSTEKIPPKGNNDVDDIDEAFVVSV